MNQYFIDISGSMMPDMILSALNIIGKQYAPSYPKEKMPASIHFINFLAMRDDLDLIYHIKDSCRELDDKCILYTDGLLNDYEKNCFDEIVVLK